MVQYIYSDLFASDLQFGCRPYFAATKPNEYEFLREVFMSTTHDENVEFLLRSLLTLDTVEDCRHFLDDLCIESEIQEMSRRLKAARMLNEGQVYSEIVTTTGLSTATISRVNRCLKYSNKGYRKVLDKMKLEEKKLYK
jgi:TrpR-related protein YerC/YecD